MIYLQLKKLLDMRYIYFVLLIFISVSCRKEQLVVEIDNDSKVDMSQSIFSTILGGQQPYSVYLPPHYASNTTKKYPVLYLLHGMNQDYKHWVTYGDLKNIVDKAISEGLPEVIVICPNGYNSLYYNTEQMRYEDFFMEEFIPVIEKKYRILDNKSNRHIAGLSMGGFGATYLGFKHHKKFGGVYSMSGGFLLTAIPFIQSILDEKNSEELTKLPRYIMECGTEDTLVIHSNDLFHQMLTNKGISHDYIRRKGKHNWQFWKESLPKALDFVSK